MKRINAFYCIKTPSDWKERAILNDKTIRPKKSKKEIKTTALQIIGGAAAAVLLVTGGVLTLYRSGEDVELSPAQTSGPQTSSKAEPIDYPKAAEDGLQSLILSDEIVIEGTFAGTTSEGNGYIFVDRIYDSGRYTNDSDGIVSYSEIGADMFQNRVLSFKINFGVKDKTTGRAAYINDLDVGSAIAVGTKFENDFYNVTAYDIVTHLDDAESRKTDGMGTQLYSELCEAVQAVYDIDASTEEGDKKLKNQVLQCVSNTSSNDMLTDCNVEIAGNYKQHTDSIGIKLQALGNCASTDYSAVKATINFPIAVTPIKDYENVKAEAVKTTDKGAVVKIGEGYYSVTSNWDNAVDFSMEGVNGEKDFDGIETHKAAVFDDDKQWIVNVRFVSHLSAYYNDDIKIYINKVESAEDISDKTDDSDVVITYQSIYSCSGEVVLRNNTDK